MSPDTVFVSVWHYIMGHSLARQLAIVILSWILVIIASGLSARQAILVFICANVVRVYYMYLKSMIKVSVQFHCFVYKSCLKGTVYIC